MVNPFSTGSFVAIFTTFIKLAAIHLILEKNVLKTIGKM